jgi:hypothetical protein
MRRHVSTENHAEPPSLTTAPDATPGQKESPS